jgi:pSer/pThr/pTyr-binding forkhead associated (FHA) protein
MSHDPHLVWDKTDGTSTEFALDKPVMVVGRESDADIMVDEPLVSRNHARFERRGDAWYVLDLGSTNLTKVNGDIVRERLLQDGDTVQFARAQLKFVIASPK